MPRKLWLCHQTKRDGLNFLFHFGRTYTFLCKSSIIDSLCEGYQRGSDTGNFTILEQNDATIPLFIYKTILKNQEKKIKQVFKEGHVMVCSSAPILEAKMGELFRELEKRSNQFMTRDTSTLLVHWSGIKHKTGPLFYSICLSKLFWAFEIIPNPSDTATLNWKQLIL